MATSKKKKKASKKKVAEVADEAPQDDGGGAPLEVGHYRARRPDPRAGKRRVARST